MCKAAAVLDMAMYTKPSICAAFPFAANAVAQEDSGVRDSAGSRAKILLIFGGLWIRSNETGCFDFVDLLNAMPLCPTYHEKSNGGIGTEFVIHINVNK